jgi:hypothetical protein
MNFDIYFLSKIQSAKLHENNNDVFLLDSNRKFKKLLAMIFQLRIISFQHSYISHVQLYHNFNHKYISFCVFEKL